MNIIYNLSIKFSANPTKLVFIYTSDTAFADNLPLYHSTEGYLFCLFEGPIDWRSTKQKTVTTFSTKAELLAITYTAKELA